MNKQDSDPKLLFQKAEALRKAEKSDEAQQQYLDTIKQAHSRTEQRNQATVDRAHTAQKKLKLKLTALLAIPVALAVATYVGYQTLDKDFSTKQAETDPKEFLFVEWLAARQTKQVLSNLAQANPNLSFDFSRSANAQTPGELLQSMTSAAMQERLRNPQNEEENLAEGNGNGGENGNGPGAFQCSIDAPPNCDDAPKAGGSRRDDIEHIVNSYRAVLENERNCEKLETSLETIAQQVQWRASEIDIKADLDSLALRCYSRQENYDKAIQYSRKMQCAGGINAINSSYWHLTANHHKKGEVATARDMYSCFRESVDFIARTSNQPWTIAASHRESGALAWLYFNDLDTAVDELESARQVLKSSGLQIPLLQSVATEIDLDLMETYVTINIDDETFSELHNDINNSGLLTDGYKQIKDTLAGIYYLQNENRNEAIAALENVAERFKHIPEYICDWDWSGFQRGLSTSIADDDAREQADQLVVATDCYVEQTIDERIVKVRNVLQWLKR
ncbi:hypothetical protein EOL70_16285 [Leucothrix sargassi]|nr:hypothetical protein EOL70_16285 [Leucothrix sargassi]